MNIVLLGPPMTGKGTQAEFISKHFKLVHLSTGDMFRDLANEQDSLGLKAKEYWSKGNLVPDELTIELFKKELKKDKYKNGFVLDGFPRTLNQAKELKKIAKINHVINIVSTDESIIKRTILRKTCSNCKKIYGLNIQPKKKDICDICGGKLMQRVDDNEETIRHRLKVYRENTNPIEEFYAQEKILINIDGDQLPEEVFDDVRNSLE
ncbi:MAG: nucleoside monophosphate kinase [Candidatus Nanoarchaeia archaeon]|nr:nucleoside monophosphate kinase [Candidatus Nanoarchaeia archaeon]